MCLHSLFFFVSFFSVFLASVCLLIVLFVLVKLANATAAIKANNTITTNNLFILEGFCDFKLRRFQISEYYFLRTDPLLTAYCLLLTAHCSLLTRFLLPSPPMLCVTQSWHQMPSLLVDFLQQMDLFHTPQNTYQSPQHSLHKFFLSDCKQIYFL